MIYGLHVYLLCIFNVHVTVTHYHNHDPYVPMHWMHTMELIQLSQICQICQICQINIYRSPVYPQFILPFPTTKPTTTQPPPPTVVHATSYHTSYRTHDEPVEPDTDTHTHTHTNLISTNAIYSLHLPTLHQPIRLLELTWGE